MPWFFTFFVDHVRFISRLSVVLPEVIGIFEYKLDRSVSTEASDPEIKPIFSVGVHGDICVALDINGEGIIRENIGRVEVAAREAAIKDDIVIEIDIIAVGMP